LGDIITRRIKADEGCLIHGKIKVCLNEESWTNAVSEYRDAQGIKSMLPVFSTNQVSGKDLSTKINPVQGRPVQGSVQ
jgi:hypothetical protein